MKKIVCQFEGNDLKDAWIEGDDTDNEDGKKYIETLLDDGTDEYLSLCKKCMGDAPYLFCCKIECGEHGFCKGCEKLHMPEYIGDKLCRERSKVSYGVYQHFKGNLYVVLDTGYDSSDGEEVVIYRSLYPDDEGKFRIWVRKKKEFMERIVRDGKEVDRFKRLDFKDYTK